MPLAWPRGLGVALPEPSGAGKLPTPTLPAVVAAQAGLAFGAFTAQSKRVGMWTVISPSPGRPKSANLTGRHAAPRKDEPETIDDEFHPSPPWNWIASCRGCPLLVVVHSDAPHDSLRACACTSTCQPWYPRRTLLDLWGGSQSQLQPVRLQAQRSCTDARVCWCAAVAAARQPPSAESTTATVFLCTGPCGRPKWCMRQQIR